MEDSERPGEERDYANERGIADEEHFNEFVVNVGGELIAPLINRPGVKNADYLFRDAEVILEHKILETDFAQSPETLQKVDGVFAKYKQDDLSDLAHPIYRELFGILRVPLRRIIEKANKQIKGAKAELQINSARGIVILVNDAFKSVPPGLIRDLIKSLLKEKERYRSVDAVLYLTNHFVEVAESPYASLLWAPCYKGYPSDKFVEFVDWLGSLWMEFQEERIGPFDGHTKGPSIDWDRAHVVTGSRRIERYEGDD